MGSEEDHAASAGMVLDAAVGAVVIAEALRERGAVCVRNVLPPQAVAYAGKALTRNAAALRALVGREVNDLPLCFADRWLEGEDVPPSLGGASMREFGDPISHSGMDRSWYDEGARNFKRWFWENGAGFPNVVLRMVLGSLLPAVYRHYFGESCVSPYQHDTVRYQRADIRDLSYPFHQDGSYHSREESQHHSLTTWIPFVACGVDAPGLELYPYKLNEILSLPEGKQMPYLFCDEQEVMRRFGDRLWTPAMSPGDVLIFDGFTVHRSHVTEQMHHQRTSADIRVFPKTRRPGLAQNAIGWVLDLDKHS